METLDDKSEGKRSIHRHKTMFMKYLILSNHLEKIIEISI